MKKELDLSLPGVMELGREELKEVDGGVLPEILKGIAIGLGIAVGVEILGDWDEFKDGFASAFN